MQPADVSSDSPPASELVAVFAQMSGFLLSQETVHSALELVTALAAETIPDSVGAGVTLLRNGAPSTTAASDAVVERADALQYELDEGPCLSAWRQGQPFRIDDTATETRWPRWTGAVAPLGMRSALSTPMIVRGQPIGAIKVYAQEPGAYDDRDAHILALFAAQAAVLLANMQSHESAVRLTDELKVMVRGRDVIGMAKGVLMATQGIDEAAAFTVLAETSRRSKLGLREVAQRVLDEPRPSEG